MAWTVSPTFTWTSLSGSESSAMSMVASPFPPMSTNATSGPIATMVPETVSPSWWDFSASDSSSIRAKSSVPSEGGSGCFALGLGRTESGRGRSEASSSPGIWQPLGVLLWRGFSARDDGLEPAPEHPFAVEGHRLGVHHLGQARVLHRLGVDAIALGAGLVDDVGEHHRLVGLQLDAARKRGPFAPLDVVGDALDVLERAVFAPDSAGLLRQAAVGREFLPRNGNHEAVDVSCHGVLLAAAVSVFLSGLL